MAATGSSTCSQNRHGMICWPDAMGEQPQRQMSARHWDRLEHPTDRAGSAQNTPSGAASGTANPRLIAAPNDAWRSAFALRPVTCTLGLPALVSIAAVSR
jgi:hypothetical protein